LGKRAQIIIEPFNKGDIGVMLFSLSRIHSFGDPLEYWA